ncbi:MAG TPA: PIN domain-containing protein [Pyrinomonadaceae bacterium]|nr:PIN domain-containing protein [Pyrinomonadaceae bacterium]
MNAVDTNVLIYARDPRDSVKQATATVLLSSLTDGVLLWQVACEYLAASRKLAPYGYDLNQALDDLADMREAWKTILPTWSVMDKAEQLLTKYHLSFWDGLLIAACLEGGVTRLYSEDFDVSAQAEGVEIVNPFKAS